MISRRIALALVMCLTCLAASHADPPGPTLEELMAAGRARRWDTLAIGERVARFGQAMEGIPYAAGTLEAPGPEVCRVPTDGLDCVTFMELALGLARTSVDPATRETTPRDVVDAVTVTRYRGGRLDGYLSRLPYTSEWIADNIARGVLEDVTPSLGGERFPLDVGFMSAHPELYPALSTRPALVDSLRAIERRIDTTRRTSVPRNRVAAIESRLRTGDLVAITTSVPGLDYAHTGIIVRDPGGARLLHASSKNGRVFLDERLGAYLSRAPRSFTGISVLRPLPPGLAGPSTGR